jgi:hypothetical protein
MSPLPRLIAAWLLVMGGAVIALKALDHVPTLLAGAPRGVRMYGSIEDAERAIGARVWMPGYYPDDLGWPPARIEVSALRPTAVAVRVTGNDGDRDRLAIVQTVEADAAAPSGLLPAGQPMEASPVTVGSHAAVLSRVLVGTRELHDLSWSQGGRRITLRYAGPVDRLLLMGGSLARRVDESGAWQPGAER